MKHLMNSTAVFAKANEGAGTPAVPPAAPVAPLPAGTITAIAKGIPIPEKSRKTGRGGSSPYKFDEMEVHDSFGVVGKTKKGMASTIFGQNKKYAEPLKNEDGTPKTEVKVGKDKNGVETRKVVPVTKQLRRFEAFDVKEDGGITVRVFRME